TAASGWSAGLDATPDLVAAKYRAGRPIFHPGTDLLRGLQPHDRGVAPAAVLQRGDGKSQPAHRRAPDVHGGRRINVVAPHEPASGISSPRVPGTDAVRLPHE